MSEILAFLSVPANQEFVGHTLAGSGLFGFWMYVIVNIFRIIRKEM